MYYAEKLEIISMMVLTQFDCGLLDPVRDHSQSLSSLLILATNLRADLVMFEVLPQLFIGYFHYQQV